VPWLAALPSRGHPHRYSRFGTSVAAAPVADEGDRLRVAETETLGPPPGRPARRSPLKQR
jgi:hypothetical protein